MNFSIKISYNLFKFNKCSCFRYLSTKALPKPNRKEITINPEDFKITSKTRNLKPQKPPFVKNLFIGNFDTDLLAYPETLSKEELASVTDIAVSIQQLFKEISPKESIGSVQQDLVNLQLFGLEGPQHIGGKNLTITEMCKCYEEIAKHPSVANIITQHECFGVKILNERGSKELQDRYLQDILTGVCITTWGVTEENIVEPNTLNTKTKLEDDNKTMILNGKKTFVTNATADLILILAETDSMNPKGFHDHKLSCLLVDMNSPGIQIEPISPSGLKQSDLCHVTFTNTPVPVANILGNPGEGMEIFSRSLTNFRLTTGAVCTTITKDVLKQATDFSMCTPNPKEPISNMDTAKTKIAKIAQNLYCMESITYFTAGLLDEYEKQDCELEAAIVKVFSSEACLSSANLAVELLGAQSYLENHWANEIFRDALGMCISAENNDSLKLSIALMGLQHAGMHLHSSVKKMRNPFFYPMYAFRKMWEQRKQYEDNPVMNLRLPDYTHPSLAVSTELLEYCTLRLKYGAEMLLIRHGAEVISQHMELFRLADAAIDTFIMSAVLGRASRSYCIGLRNGDYECLMAHTICLSASERVKENIRKIVAGRYATNDQNDRKVAEKVFKHKGNFAEHPLTKNF